MVDGEVNNQWMPKKFKKKKKNVGNVKMRRRDNFKITCGCQKENFEIFNKVFYSFISLNMDKRIIKIIE